MTLVTQLSLTIAELLQNGLQPHCQVTPLWSMRAMSQAHHYIDSDAWCKRALKGPIYEKRWRQRFAHADAPYQVGVAIHLGATHFEC